MSRQGVFPVTDSDRSAADDEIKAKQQEVKYDLRDFTVDYIVQQFHDDLFYVPDYQREYIWRTRHKCRFIESIVLGLPVPMMFVASMDDGRLEIDMAFCVAEPTRKASWTKRLAAGLVEVWKLPRRTGLLSTSDFE